MFHSPRARLSLRWGGGIALLLAVQSLVLAGIFWTLTTQGRIRDAEAGFAADCRAFAWMSGAERSEEVREALDRDIHRDRFLALFDANGALVEGNVAAIPAHPASGGSHVATIRPTRLPGKTSDVARFAVCAFPDGARLFTGLDLDDADYAARVVLRALWWGLLPGLALAAVVGAGAGGRAARRIDAVGAFTRRVMAGDLRERLRIPPGPPDSFGLLCRQINAMLDRLETLVADVRGIGDDVAHQIRTPLTRLRARVERSVPAPSDPVAASAAASAVLADIDKLLAIVAAVLRIREIEDRERRSRFAAIDPARLVADACDLYRPVIEEAGGELSAGILPTQDVFGDASLLMEAVANLIDNAVKFGPAGGVVAVRLHEENRVPVVTVLDQGGGVPRAERAAVLQRFYRARRDREGAGLGLSLVQAIAALHGFRLRFEDDGSAVSLLLGGDDTA